MSKQRTTVNNLRWLGLIGAVLFAALISLVVAIMNPPAPLPLPPSALSERVERERHNTAKSAPSFEEIQAIFTARCAACHAAQPTVLRLPAKGVVLDTEEQLRQHAASIYYQTIERQLMPPGNMTQMTEAERVSVGVWLRGGNN